VPRYNNQLGGGASGLQATYDIYNINGGASAWVLTYVTSITILTLT